MSPRRCTEMFEFSLDAGFSSEVVNPQDIGIGREAIPVSPGGRELYS